MEVIDTLCEILDCNHPRGAPHNQLKTFVTDRPGHDHRYAIDFSKIKMSLVGSLPIRLKKVWSKQWNGISTIKNGVKMSHLENIKERG